MKKKQQDEKREDVLWWWDHVYRLCSSELLWLFLKNKEDRSDREPRQIMLKPWIFSCETNDFVGHRMSRNSRNPLYLLPFLLSKNPLGASWAHCNMIFVGFSSIPWLLMQPTIKIRCNLIYIYTYMYVTISICHYLRMLYYHHYRCDVKATFPLGLADVPASFRQDTPHASLARPTKRDSERRDTIPFHPPKPAVFNCVQQIKKT